MLLLAFLHEQRFEGIRVVGRGWQTRPMMAHYMLRVAGQHLLRCMCMYEGASLTS